MGVARVAQALLLLAAFTPPTDGLAAAESFDGRWRSDGYGYWAELQAGQLSLFEITPLSCLPSETFRSQDEPADPRGARYVSTRRPTVLFLSAGPSADSAWFHEPGAASKTLFRRTAERPPTCERKTSDDPATSFEVFAWTLAAHHGFLQHRGVDWAAATQAARAKVNARTEPAQLFEILRGMIEPLHDIHTFVQAPPLKRGFQGKRPGTLLLTDAEIGKTLEILETRYLQGKLRSWCNGHLRYARSRQGPGYLRIDSFFSYVQAGHGPLRGPDDAGFEEGARALAAALDEILADAAPLPGLVIDVRVNRGGSDPYGVQIAERLSGEPYVAFVKRARNDPARPESWTEPQPTTVYPSARPGFRKAVVELIGADTVSAGETFTMALIGRRPRILRVGADTQGVFSDILVRSLPNGWRFGLPNEVFLTEQGEHFEARGVPPDVQVPVFPPADLAAGRDGALARALELLLDRGR
jgi:hypothetical protein